MNFLFDHTYKYPPFNLKKVADDKYTIELAVAGFAKQDLDIQLAGSKLVVSGKLSTQDEAESFLWKGISSKPFSRTFTLADNVELKNAELVNGMLKIWLESISTATKKVDIK